MTIIEKQSREGEDIPVGSEKSVSKQNDQGVLTAVYNQSKEVRKKAVYIS